MKSKKGNGKGTQAVKRGMKDLPVCDAKARNATGGSFNNVAKSLGDALATAARKG
jgi:hypothetical protein